MAPSLRTARSLWVVATTAHYGFPALAARRPYACWVGTSLRAERAARLAGQLPRSRRLAAIANAPALDRIERAVLHGAARVYATSGASVREVCAVADLPSTAVDVLPLTVDLRRLHPEPDESWVARLDAPTIVFVGRADDPRKNVALLVDSFARLRCRFPAARLRLVGRPPGSRLLARLPPGVEVLGELDSVDAALRSATLFVLPSLQEGFGIVVAEALACGVPAIVTPCGGPEELVRTSGGGTVLSGFDASELAGALAALLDDPGRLLELRRRGRAYVEHAHSPHRLRTLLAPALREMAE